MKGSRFGFVLLIALVSACGKKADTTPVIPPQQTVFISSVYINTTPYTNTVYGTSIQPSVTIHFSQPVKETSVQNAVSITDAGGVPTALSTIFQNHDSVVTVQPATVLKYLSRYSLNISNTLLSASGGALTNPFNQLFITQLDSSNKFPLISDSALLDKVQQQTFKFFWDFGHPVCRMALERSNSDKDIVTTGGSGFGIMSMIVAVNRGFIARADAVQRLNTITTFLSGKCQRWHGAFSHWINGTTGATVAFGNNDGADIVETSYLCQGLLCARQYFNSPTDAGEKQLRDSINAIWNNVEWNWFTQNGSQQSIYWQYNPSYTSSSDIWSIPVAGWNEALITYVLAASSTSHAISKQMYDQGWAQNGGIKNGATYYGYPLPLGPALGGPLFFEHYSFLGINPNGLFDNYGSYGVQTINHTLINYSYCVSNPNSYYGYSNLCWGLTASDIQNGYTASSPTNDVGVIAPTAAISSLPYSPVQSMNAIRFFYYKLGDKIWGQYGFVDAFNLSAPWFDTDCLAIDQGPQIVMIENYRSGLLWNLFMNCPEIKNGMKTVLQFSSPFL